MKGGTVNRDSEHWDAFWQARNKAVSQEDAGARDPAPAVEAAKNILRDKGPQVMAIGDTLAGLGLGKLHYFPEQAACLERGAALQGADRLLNHLLFVDRRLGHGEFCRAVRVYGSNALSFGAFLMHVFITRFIAGSFAFLALTLPGAVPAEALGEELRACRDLTDDQARLACYDAAVDRNRKSADAGPEPSAENAAGSAAAEPAVTAASLSQEELFGRTSKEIELSVEEATGSERIDSLSATVTRLRKYGYDKVLITLDNGQVWKQIDASSLRLRVGDTVDIERAALGSFMLRKQGNNRRMRISRED
jgi:hypothetical protein